MTNIYAALTAAIRQARRGLLADAQAGTLSGTDAVACEALVPEWAPGRFEIGDVRARGGQVWRCVQPHNNANNPDIEPGKSPAHWVPYHTTDARRAKPFVLPTCAEDAYYPGEVCLWEDQVWRSVLETANTYSPADYPQGWERVSIGG